MFRVLYVLCFLLSLQAALANEYQYHQTAACCDKIDSESDLLRCIEGVDYGTKDIAIITYASSDIVDYAAYAFAVNSAYAEQNGYEMYFLNEAGGANYEPRDARWKKEFDMCELSLFA